MGKESGFTLVELMTQQVSRAARDVYSTLQSAKMSAITDNVNVFVTFVPGMAGSGTYQVFEDLNNNNASDAGEVIRSGQMPLGVEMVSANFAGGGPTRFTRLGLTTGRNGRVIITNGNHTLDVVVNSVGGIRVE